VTDSTMSAVGERILGLLRELLVATLAAMRPSEKTIRRRFGSFREAFQRAALS
jgi:hypothetical protein